MGLELSRIGKTQRLFRLVTRANPDQPLQAVLGASHELPFATDSLDALVLCHTLNTSSVPHQTLRECQRVLVPNGHLFVISFNPLSIRGAASGLRRWLSRGRRHTKSVSGRRLGDWLSLLGVLPRRTALFCEFRASRTRTRGPPHGSIRPLAGENQCTNRDRLPPACPQAGGSAS